MHWRFRKCNVVIIILHILISFFKGYLISSQSVIYDRGLINVTIDLRQVGLIKMILYCKNCDTPDSGGSFAYGILPKYLPILDFSLDKLRVTGFLVYCVPNLAERDKLLNRIHLRNRIVLVNRGQIPILEKCIKLQQAGARGVIIADDGQCLEDFSYCGVRAGSINEEGFASYDDPQAWKVITIPVILINLSTANRLRKVMMLKEVEIPGYGSQNITMARNRRGEYEEL